MMRIAFLFSTLEGFGLVKIMFYLVKYLKRNPLFDIQVITLSPEPKNSFIQAFQEAGIPVHCLGMSRLKGMFYSQKELIRLLNRLHIQVLHSNGFRANLIHSQIAKQTPHIREVMTIHLDPNDDAKHPLGPLFWFWRKKKHLAVIKACPCAVACSRSISASLTKYGIEIPFIQNGIDLEALTGKEVAQTTSHPFGAIHSPRFVVLSGLHKRKHVDVIIKAFNQLGSGFPLLVLGDGTDLKKLKKLAVSNHILFLGYQSNTVPYLKQSDIFISASSSEGLPLSVMEAMFMENIPVLSTIPSHLEIVENSPLMAYSFGCNEVDAIVTHCRKLVTLDLTPLKQVAKKIVVDHFSADRMADAYIALYKKLV